MKFHLEIVNSSMSASVDNVHIFCMFEAADTVENMWKVFAVFQKQISTIQDPSVTLGDCPVRLFLGGDFHFLDDCLGHQG